MPYNMPVFTARASVINHDNKMIILAYIGRIIWSNQIIKRITARTYNNYYTKLFDTCRNPENVSKTGIFGVV